MGRIEIKTAKEKPQCDLGVVAVCQMVPEPVEKLETEVSRVCVLPS